MIRDKRVLALIPARAGSKGLPGKNIKPLYGKPLISWSIDTALNSKYVDEVIVSTDSKEIAKLAELAGASVPFIRPETLATDTSTSVDVAIHALVELHSKRGQDFDYLILLEPTSPLRDSADIESMLEKLDANSNEYDGIISLGEVREHPAYMKRIEGKKFSNLLKDFSSTSRRQDNEPIYFPFGLAYIVKCKTLNNEKTFYPQNCTYFVISPEQCYEIDTIQDFLFIETLIKRKMETE